METNENKTKIIVLNLDDFITTLLYVLVEENKINNRHENIDLLNDNKFIISCLDEENSPLEVLEKSFDKLRQDKKVIRRLLDRRIENHTHNLPHRKLYKYISNKSDYLHLYFKNKISFADSGQFDDIFDCVHLKQNIKNRARILCLSKCNNIPAMWGTYANKFNGFCFEYNCEDIVDSIASTTNYDVSIILGNEIFYDDKELIDIEIHKSLEEKQNVKRFIKILKGCFKKDSSWNYQKEYRFITFANKKYEKPFPDYDIIPTNYYFWDLENKILKVSK